MTEKFNELKLDSNFEFLKENGVSNLKKLLKDTVLGILSLIKHTCKHYPEKIKSFLMEYNSYVILKKLPSYFDNDEKMIKKASKLIKIQLPYFTKKKKNTVGNMKMISEIYGKFLNFDFGKSDNSIEYRTFDPNKNTENQTEKSISSQKIKNFGNDSSVLNNSRDDPSYLLKSLDKYEKNNFRNLSISKIDNSEILRKVHADFNNRHYLKVEFDSEGESTDQFSTYNRIFSRMWNDVKLDENFKDNYQEWLEENIWNYYD